MKRHIFLLFIVVPIVIGMFFSCEENMPVIPDAPDVTSNKKVLVEEFTGVQCVNCPIGSIELENLLALYGENLIVVSIHAGDFAPPWPQNQYDFRTPEAENLINYLGNPPAYPSAVINRRDYDGGFYILQYPLARWTGFIDEALETDAKIGVTITKEYDTETRELKVQVTGLAAESLSGDLRLTIMITENNIVDAQETPSAGIILDYNHKHVFRTTMTNFDGDSFATELSAGQNYNESYTMTLPEEWNASECDVIAFVSLVAGDENKEVLQAAQVHIED